MAHPVAGRRRDVSAAETIFSAALADAAAAVSSSLRVEQVLDHILEQVSHVVPADTCNIMLIDGDGARIVRWRGYEAIGISDDDIARVRPSITAYGTFRAMIETGRPVLIGDTFETTTWVATPGRVDHRSYVGAPICVDGKVEGFINANSSRPGQFSQRDADRLRAFASHAAIALKNARLYEQTHEYAEMLEQRVEERTAELRERTARVEAILRSTSDGIIVTNADGDITELNPVASSWLHHSLPEADIQVLRRAVRAVVHHAEEDSPQLVELTDLDLELRAAPISGSDARSAMVVAAHDVTHLRAVERMRSQFISDISHELRTPVTTIKLYASLLRAGSPEKQDVYFQSLEKETERIADLVGAIVKIARIESGRFELAPTLADMNVVISCEAQSAAPIAAAKGLSVIESITDDPLMVYIDSTWFIEAVSGIVKNALLYTDRGEIRISTEATTQEGTAWATCTIEDTGPGIPFQEQAHLFERFFRGDGARAADIPGNGLGLVIAKAAIERHGGAIAISSVPGAGTRVTIRLPLAEVAERHLTLSSTHTHGVTSEQ